jgi:hypothetical protein
MQVWQVKAAGWLAVACLMLVMAIAKRDHVFLRNLLLIAAGLVLLVGSLILVR